MSIRCFISQDNYEHNKKMLNWNLLKNLFEFDCSTKKNGKKNFPKFTKSFKGYFLVTGNKISLLWKLSHEEKCAILRISQMQYKQCFISRKDIWKIHFNRSLNHPFSFDYNLCFVNLFSLLDKIVPIFSLLFKWWTFSTFSTCFSFLLNNSKYFLQLIPLDIAIFSWRIFFCFQF